MDTVLKQQNRIEILEELLNERYSVRAFLPKPVPRETIEHVLSVAQRTASWCNSQPWQVLIASGEAKERFRKSIYAEAASGAKDDHDLQRHANISVSIWSGGAKAVSSSTTRSA